MAINTFYDCFTNISASDQSKYRIFDLMENGIKVNNLKLFLHKGGHQIHIPIVYLPTLQFCVCLFVLNCILELFLFKTVWVFCWFYSTLSWLLALSLTGHLKVTEIFLCFFNWQILLDTFWIFKPRTLMRVPN